jgi:hypothetical protein
MKKLHRIVAKHNKFKTIPVHTFYFSNNKDLIEATRILFEDNFKITFNLKMDALSIRELIKVYSCNPLIIDEEQLSYNTKKEITEIYERDYNA